MRKNKLYWKKPKQSEKENNKNQLQNNHLFIYLAIEERIVRKHKTSPLFFFIIFSLSERKRESQ